MMTHNWIILDVLCLRARVYLSIWHFEVRSSNRPLNHHRMQYRWAWFITVAVSFTPVLPTFEWIPGFWRPPLDTGGWRCTVEQPRLNVQITCPSMVIHWQFVMDSSPMRVWNYVEFSSRGILYWLMTTMFFKNRKNCQMGLYRSRKYLWSWVWKTWC